MKLWLISYETSLSGFMNLSLLFMQGSGQTSPFFNMHQSVTSKRMSVSRQMMGTEKIHVGRSTVRLALLTQPRMRGCNRVSVMVRKQPTTASSNGECLHVGTFMTSVTMLTFSVQLWFSHKCPWKMESHWFLKIIVILDKIMPVFASYRVSLYKMTSRRPSDCSLYRF